MLSVEVKKFNKKKNQILNCNMVTKKILEAKWITKISSKNLTDIYSKINYLVLNVNIKLFN